ncbi:hypothetical protein QFC22_003831 [Naganishia vaughanmartiniae]|uniref:Uncharacterized protein n=1 Tax=Naganishia vaughanmartiniae TaxID=1424756 RepID=A0ACC2X4N2_9TREE|nr:hypothetical protein QFC22_003831 [Naganishia vaughanmartiniae]
MARHSSWPSASSGMMLLTWTLCLTQVVIAQNQQPDVVASATTSTVSASQDSTWSASDSPSSSTASASQDSAWSSAAWVSGASSMPYAATSTVSASQDSAWSSDQPMSSTGASAAQETGSSSSAMLMSSIASPTAPIAATVIVTDAPSGSPSVTAAPRGNATATAAPTVTIVVSNHTNPLFTYDYLSGIKINDTSPGVNNSWSPPFYPTPETRGQGNWTYAVDKARTFVASLTLEEKVNLTTGVGWQGGRCVGNIPAIERVGFQGLCLQDAPLGVRLTDGVSAFPSGLNAAATFDRQLMYERALAIGHEFKGKGVNIALGPGMNGGGRVATSGRQWEMAGGDPYLAGESAYYSVRGLQDAGVQACAKHYILNEQERNRTTSSSNVDDATIHEIYLHPFLRAVQADVSAVMCSYNLVNSSWACQNSKAVNGLLKHELGFQGQVMSDWQATHSGVDAALAGLDQSMPGDVTFSSGDSYFGKNLTLSVNNGSVPLSRVEDMAIRVMAGYFLLGQDSNYPSVNFDTFKPNGPLDEHVNVQDDHAEIIRKVGAASTILLKNENGTLPLRKPRTLAMIGSDAGPPARGPNGFSDRGGVDGTLAMGWGSGTTQFPYLISPLEAIQRRAIQDHTLVSWSLEDFDLGLAVSTAAKVDVAIVFLNSDSGEEYIVVDGNIGDRNNLTAWHGGDELVLAVANVTSNVVVVVHNPGPMDMEAWIDHPNVTAVLLAGLPGQESGNSIVEIIYGDYNPSAKLPFTLGRKDDDYPAQIAYINSNLDPEPQIDYKERLNVDYRHFLSNNITPRYGFGHGLSYTSFNSTNLQVRALGQKEMQRRNDWHKEMFTAANATNEVGSSLSKALHAPRWEVSVDIQNVGGVYGCDVPQLYLGFPEGSGEPPRVLRGFERITLEPWKVEKARFPLSRYDLSIWDTELQRWRIPEGDFTIYVTSMGAFDMEPLTGTIPSGWLPNGKTDDIYAW